MIPLNNPYILFGDHTKNIKFINERITLGGDGIKIIKPLLINTKYLYYHLKFNVGLIGERGYSRYYSELKKKPLFLPPLNEQRRIIQTIEDIYNVIDEIESLQVSITILEKKIKERSLSLAMQGKLLPQNPDDEPASILINQIKEEKEKLISEGKIKRNKNESTIVRRGESYYELIGEKEANITSEVPYLIPQTWEWVRLENISNYGVTRLAVPSSINNESWILDLEDIEKNTGQLLRKKKMKEIESSSNKYIFNKGDVLYSKLRPYLNKVIIADEEGYSTTEILPIKFIDQISDEFAKYYLMSPHFVKYATEASYGMKMPRLGTKDGKRALFPILSYNEQIRIVKKLEAILQV